MLLAKNRKALFNYEIIEKYIAGISLLGFEVKAIKEGKASFEGSYIKIDQGKPSVHNLTIGRYSKQSKTPHEYEETRPRELLLNKKEIAEMVREISERGKTAVPLALILQHGKIKLELATVKGKKEFEKKVTAKERQQQKDLVNQAKESIRAL